jgi:3-hydroxyacyl-CoA dehydrogenase/enoyl-CoA hydratase/3-hydroxybutyryl-CoA epimerase
MNETLPSPVVFSLDADGVGWITFDDPTARANVFNTATQAAFASALDAAMDARALVIVSGKEKIFIAGADLNTLAALPDADTAAEFARSGQRLFQRVADLSIPVVCAIHGACAGGGFELALACHWCIASDAPETRIGLPETSLGIIPGWGGSVRLSRLVGAKVALDHILKAQLRPARDAFQEGLVDVLVPVSELRSRAKLTALELAAEGIHIRTRATPAAAPQNFFSELRASILAKTHGWQPALITAIDVVEQTVTCALAPALEIEAVGFGEVAAGAVCKNLLHVYFLRDAAKKRTLEGWFDARPSRKTAPAPIRRVGIVGAGVMGSGIAHWLAAHGCEVVLRDVQRALVERGLGVIRTLFDESVQRGTLSAGDASTALGRILGTTGWDGFETCDLIIEAIVENAAAKRKLFGELSAIVRPDALLASNTSALPIEEFASEVSDPTRTLGLHFFNPVSRMPLVELILAPRTSAETAERALAFVKSLGKTPVICRSSPGFLVTRVLFFYLNEAVRLWESGASTSMIDDALREVGWPMGPMRLIDEVGIDVTDFIFGELAHYFPERFVRTTACSRLIAAGFTGRKNGTGTGFYGYSERTPRSNDDATRAIAGPTGTFDRAADEIARDLMDVMIGEARRCLDEGVVRSTDDIDFAFLSGAGFPAFHGGLMRYAEHAHAVASERHRPRREPLPSPPEVAEPFRARSAR